MNSQLLQQLNAGIRLVQGLTGETITIAGTNYTCTASTMVTGDPEFVAGGLINKLAITVTVLASDLPVLPPIDTLVSFRGLPYRTISYEDAGISWQIDLVQEQA